MTKYKLFFLTVFQIFIFYKGICQKITPKDLVGEWSIHSFQSSTRFIFNDNNKYSEFYDSLKINYGGRIRYDIHVRNDSTFLFLTFTKSNVNGKWKRNHIRKYLILLNEDFLTQISYKSGTGISQQIDEYRILKRKTDTPKRAPENFKPIKYVFPENFKGSAWIAFNQPNGVKPTYDSLGVPILKIPENGLLLTSLHEDAYATANGVYSIVKESRIDSGFANIKSFDKFSEVDSTCCGNKELIAIMCGFNQAAREYINNNIFKNEITGNVMTIYICTFSEFEENRIFPWK